MELNELLTKLVDSRIASSSFDSLRDTLLKRYPSGEHAFRVGEYNVLIYARPYGGLRIARHVRIDRVEEIVQTSKEEAYIPKVGDLFRVRFKDRQDASYASAVWRCTSSDARAVIAENVLGASGPSVMFLAEQWDFFSVPNMNSEAACAYCTFETASATSASNTDINTDAVRRAETALECAFVWSWSPEGREYWLGVCNNLRSKIGMPARR